MIRNLAELEAIIWSQTRNLNAHDPLTRTTAMEAILTAINAYTQTQAGPIIARRRSALEDTN